MFKETDQEGWKFARVIASFKKNSKYKYRKHLELDDGLIVEKDFEKGIKEWKIKEEPEDTDDVEDNIFLGSGDAFPVQIVSPKDYDMPEVKAAIVAEISKYKSFNAFKEVEDNGQRSIPTRWVVTVQSDSGINEPYKARLCMRGDLERGKNNI